MIEEAFKDNIDLFIPMERATPTSRQSYLKYKILNVKFSPVEEGLVTGNTGVMKTVKAQVFTDNKRSVFEAIPKEGDIICMASESPTPTDSRYIVKSIEKHSFKGALHHFILNLV